MLIEFDCDLRSIHVVNAMVPPGLRIRVVSSYKIVSIVGPPP